MTTLTMKGPRLRIARRRKDVYFSGLRVFVDRGGHVAGDPVPDPPRVPRTVLTVEKFAERLKRHNALPLPLHGPHRVLLRWSEGGGNGMPNPEAEVRDTHYDPLPPNEQELVDEIVAASPFELLTRKWYRTDKSMRELAEDLGVAKTKLYEDWRCALWYYRGVFISNLTLSGQIR